MAGARACGFRRYMRMRTGERSPGPCISNTIAWPRPARQVDVAIVLTPERLSRLVASLSGHCASADHSHERGGSQASQRHASSIPLLSSASQARVGVHGRHRRRRPCLRHVVAVRKAIGLCLSRAWLAPACLVVAQAHFRVHQGAESLAEVAHPAQDAGTSTRRALRRRLLGSATGGSICASCSSGGDSLRYVTGARCRGALAYIQSPNRAKQSPRSCNCFATHASRLARCYGDRARRSAPLPPSGFIGLVACLGYRRRTTIRW